MVNDKQNREAECGRFREELELVRVPGDAVIARGELLAELSAELREHAGECRSCLQALEDVAETRNLLLPLAVETGGMQPGPWFATKVMNAIAAKEKEDDVQDGFWICVQRLAPRLAAVCALLLVLVGTWAVQTQREYQARQTTAPGESLFETASSSPTNDEILTNVGAHR
jgi:hypothetical protein